MKDKIVIPKGNKKAVSIINDLLNAKTALREFIAQGGKAKDFRVTTSRK
jgi:hypothetical protein